jgi:hypothetical protein
MYTNKGIFFSSFFGLHPCHKFDLGLEKLAFKLNPDIRTRNTNRQSLNLQKIFHFTHATYSHTTRYHTPYTQNPSTNLKRKKNIMAKKEKFI